MLSLTYIVSIDGIVLIINQIQFRKVVTME